MGNALQFDNLVFAPEEDRDDEAAAAPRQAPWKVIIADDEKEVHTITRLALAGFSFAGRDLEFISAYSGADAVRAVDEHPDAALLLLDVVMESEHAGLDAVRKIRETLGDTAIRIVLRTGQPGQAPEHSVVQQYDINDYREKTELTAQKMLTLVYSSLRAYRDIMALEASKYGLERIIESSTQLFRRQSVSEFTREVIEQLTALVNFDRRAPDCGVSGLAAECDGLSIRIAAATGDYADLVGRDAADVLPETPLFDIGQALNARGNIVGKSQFTGYFRANSEREYVFQVSVAHGLSALHGRLLSVFFNTISIAYENVRLTNEIEESQNEILYILADAVETRCEEIGSHVKRVAECSKFIALKYGLGEATAELLRVASPLHDVGKISVPDSILNKAGPLTPDEWEIMRGHAEAGYRLLRASSRPVIRAAATIALEHHEKWNGTGYPHGKSGRDIHIFGRITAIADVFDALANERPYKSAWQMDAILEHLKAESGRHFDPDLVDIVVEHADELVAIGERGAASYHPRIFAAPV